MTLGCGNSSKNNSPSPDISEAKDAFCYLKAESAQMYANPDKGRNQLWQFSKGEVLSVIGSKSVNQTPWLQVKFTGNVKAGYEEFLKIEEAPSIKMGWVQGTVEELVSCK